jgi:hypothetical protein
MPVRRGDGENALTAGYQFYQSVHIDLEDYNVGQHVLLLDGRFDGPAGAQTSVRYQYAYLTFGGDRYSAIHRIAPSVSLAYAGSQRTELFVAREIRNYFDFPRFAGNLDRDGATDGIGLVHQASLGGRSAVRLTYERNRDSADAPWWRNDGWKGSAEASVQAGGMVATIGASVNEKHYDAPLAAGQAARNDSLTEYVFRLSRVLGTRLSLEFSESYGINRSNIDAFTYRRNIAGLFAAVKL